MALLRKTAVNGAGVIGETLLVLHDGAGVEKQKFSCLRLAGARR